MKFKKSRRRYTIEHKRPVVATNGTEQVDIPQYAERVEPIAVLLGRIYWCAKRHTTKATAKLSFLMTQH